jgi:hypothetical protein
MKIRNLAGDFPEHERIFLFFVCRALEGVDVDHGGPHVVVVKSGQYMEGHRSLALDNKFS